jgi:glutathione-regulated potassium-efflux system ancillary protein KefF
MFSRMNKKTDDSRGPRIYVLAAHPHWRDSRVNRQLMEVARALPDANIEVNDLYGSYPDYAIDIDAEKARAAKADLIVLLHPIQWYSMPPLQKLWFDEVLAWGWAYGPGGEALRGKDCWLVATTGGPESSYHPQSYNRYFFDAFIPPYEQTATLCGMRFLPPLLFHGARSAALDDLTAHVEVFRQRLASYPNWPELEQLDACPTCVVPETDRPVEADDFAKVQAAVFKGALTDALARSNASSDTQAA